MYPILVSLCCTAILFMSNAQIYNDTIEVAADQVIEKISEIIKKERAYLESANYQEDEEEDQLRGRDKEGDKRNGKNCNFYKDCVQNIFLYNSVYTSSNSTMCGANAPYYPPICSVGFINCYQRSVELLRDAELSEFEKENGEFGIKRMQLKNINYHIKKACVDNLDKECFSGKTIDRAIEKLSDKLANTEVGQILFKKFTRGCQGTNA